MNTTAHVSIGSVIGRNVSGSGVTIAGCEAINIGNIDITGYPTDPQTAGDGNSGLVIDSQDGATSACISIQAGRLRDFTGQGVWLKNCTDSTVSLGRVSADEAGLRIDGPVSGVKVSGTYDGSITDLNRNASSQRTDLSGCYFADRVGAIEQHGGQRSVSVISPVGVLTPWYIGQFCEITTQGQRFQAMGLSNTDWMPMSTPYSTTAASIEDAGNAVNTQGKFIGRLVWDATNVRMLRATGGGATNGWQSLADGSLVIPS